MRAHSTRSGVSAPLTATDESLLLELVIRTLKNMLREELRKRHRERDGEVSEYAIRTCYLL